MDRVWILSAQDGASGNLETIENDPAFGTPESAHEAFISAERFWRNSDEYTVGLDEIPTEHGQRLCGRDDLGISAVLTCYRVRGVTTES